MPARKNKIDPRAIRQASGLTQVDFWRKLGVTQSGGSRYERGRGIPKPVAQLIDLIYVRGIDTALLNAQNLAILHYLETDAPELLGKLQRAVVTRRSQNTAQSI